jgi:predicted HicB family RNase H-like nuclease
LTIRVSEEELKAWKEEAWQARMSLSAWVRAKLSGEALEPEPEESEGEASSS